MMACRGRSSDGSGKARASFYRWKSHGAPPKPPYKLKEEKGGKRRREEEEEQKSPSSSLILPPPLMHAFQKSIYIIPAINVNINNAFVFK